MRISVSAAVVCALFALQVTCAHGSALSPEVMEASGSFPSVASGNLVDRRSLATTGCGDGYISGSLSLTYNAVTSLDCSWTSTCDKWTYEVTLSVTAGDYIQVVYATGDTCSSTVKNLWTEAYASSTGSIQTSGTLQSSSTRTCLGLTCQTASGCVSTYSKLQLTCTTETDTLSDAVIAGIVIGCIVAVALSIVACAWCCKCCCFQRKEQPAQPAVVMMQPGYVMPK